MTYFGVIASAVLHVGGLFLLLSARAPEPMQPLGGDTPLDVSIISVDEYIALTSRAPQSSTLAALREQPATPEPPQPVDLDPQVDVTPETPQDEPEAVELAMRLPPPEPDIVPQIDDEPEQPDSSEVAVAPAPPPIAVDEDAMQDEQVDPNDLIPNDDVSVAVAPPTPKPPRGVFDAPVIDMSPDEPPVPSETEGEGEEVAEEAAPPPPEPEPEPVQTAEAEDPAPLATPMPIPKPRGSLAVASEPEPAPAPAQVAEATPQPAPTPAPAPLVEQPAPQSQLSEAEMEQERRMMAALMEQMRAAQPPTVEEQRAAEAEALRKLAEEQRAAQAEALRKQAEEQRRLAEEQQRQRELAAMNEAERRAAEEAARLEAARLAALEEQARLAALQAEAQAKADAEREARALADLRAQQEAALQAQRAEQEAARRAAIEEQLRRQEAELERQRQEAARLQAERDRALRQQQLAQLNSTLSPETTAGNVLTGTVPAPTAAPSAAQSIDDRFASMLSTAGNFANQASTGPSFSQGGGVRQGASLTPGETQAVLNQLRRCWRVDTFSANARSQVVTLRAQIRQNGFVNQATIQVAAPLPTPPEYRIAVERAISALQDRRCQPFALPPAKYNAWRDIVIRFDPAQMVLQ